MALKDTWRDLVDSTNGVDGDDISVEPINDIAHTVIENEEKIKQMEETQPSIILDKEMSDTSENAVQNKVIKLYVDDIMGDVDNALDSILAIQDEHIDVTILQGEENVESAGESQ